jgi:hypothetical protein
MVPATLSRARLGAMLMRGSNDASDHVESLKSPGMKKCCSICGVDAFERVPGSEGTGGMRPGDSGGDRTVTPGM